MFDIVDLLTHYVCWHLIWRDTSKLLLYPVRVKVLAVKSGQYGPVLVGCLSRVIPNTPILLHEDAKQQQRQEGVSCQLCIPVTVPEKLLASIYSS